VSTIILDRAADATRLDDEVAHDPGEPRTLAVGVDVGGTSIKCGLADLAIGRLVGSPVRRPTPRPPVIGAVIEAIGDALAELARDSPSSSARPLAVALSGDVRDGWHTSGVNLDPSWVGAPARAMLQAHLGRELRILNDADAAGLAEMRYGAGRGRSGVVIVLTLGTGIGSGLFVDGLLAPNSCLGQFPFQGDDAEVRLSSVARERRGLSWHAWADELSAFLAVVEAVLRPALIILGGGGGEAWPRYEGWLRRPCPVVPAALGNTAGIVGAAWFGHRPDPTSGEFHSP
jgi:polyphosphate glucokinase